VTVPATKPRVRKDLTVVELDGEAVVYDERTGDMHHLNPTATLVFGLCDGTATGRELAQDLAGAYGQPVDEVVQQVQVLLRQFRKAKLVETTAAGNRAGSDDG
jgi:PqqD family protein of HPr-rel-A system